MNMVQRRIDAFNYILTKDPFYSNHGGLKRVVENNKTFIKEVHEQIKIRPKMTHREFKTDTAYLYLDLKEKPKDWTWVTEIIVTIADRVRDDKTIQR